MAFGFCLVALFGGAGQVEVSPPASSTGAGHVGLDFALGPSAPATPLPAWITSIVLVITGLPYFIWWVRHEKLNFIVRDTA
jgi:hypothetical protein